MAEHQKYNLLDSIINGVPERDYSLQELNQRADHAIHSVINIIDDIEEVFDPEIADDLIRRLLLSIKNRDSKKFEKGMENFVLTGTSCNLKRSGKRDEEY